MCGCPDLSPRKRTELVPAWTAGDERRLAQRVARMNPPAPVEAKVCERCIAGDHHAAKPVGPYLICRCLWCAELVVGTT